MIIEDMTNKQILVLSHFVDIVDKLQLWPVDLSTRIAIEKLESRTLTAYFSSDNMKNMFNNI